MRKIGLVGFTGVGKDTVSDFLITKGFSSFAFADPLKECVASIFGWELEMLKGKTPESRIWREEVDTWWSNKLEIPNFTPRFALRFFGTDVMRKNFHEDIWLLHMEKRLQNHTGSIVISDIRFKNEIDLARKFGSEIYRVSRGPDPKWMATASLANNGDQTSITKMIKIHQVHESDWSWIGTNLDGTLRNDGTISDLHSECERILF